MRFSCIAKDKSYVEKESSHPQKGSRTSQVPRLVERSAGRLQLIHPNPTPMNKRTTPNIIKKPFIASALLFSFALTGMAQEFSPNCFIKKNASWHEDSSWSKGRIPTQEDKTAIINFGSSAIVDEPVEEIINVGVGNGNSAQPDGTVTINADFNVIEIAVAGHAASSGRVEQNSGVVILKMLSLASTHPDPIEATYDLEAGKLETQNLKLGTMGSGMLSVKGTGEVVSVALKSEVGSQATLRFCGSAAGFPTMSFGTYTIEPGAALEVEGNKAVKPGKYPLILADEPLAGRFNVNLTGFAAGKAKLLENEPGVVLEVK